MSIKLQDFLHEWLTCILHFEPGEKLDKAIVEYLYQGKVIDGPPPDPWSLPCSTFYEECEKATEYYFKNCVENLKKA